MVIVDPDRQISREPRLHCSGVKADGMEAARLGFLDYTFYGTGQCVHNALQHITRSIMHHLASQSRNEDQQTPGGL